MKNKKYEKFIINYFFELSLEVIHQSCLEILKKKFILS